jgi:kynurenine formamidase
MTTIIDLSVPLRNYSFDTSPLRITYYDHVERGRLMAQQNGFELTDMYPDPGIGGSNEDVTLSSHAGTHVDAPYHYGPFVGTAPSKTIDQVPLAWCFGDGVLLDFSDRPAGYVITVEDVKGILSDIRYSLKAGDIVLIRTGADERFDRRDYADNQCGLGAESFEWMLDHGIRTFGTDAFSLDTSWSHMVAALKAGDKSKFFPVTYQVGRQREHIRAQKLGNLHRLPRPFGFKVAMFPVMIERASGSWARVVAIFDGD